jgi:hypothetical protein
VAVITQQVYDLLDMGRRRLHDEIVNHYYVNGKGSPGSPARLLRTYGFLSKNKKKLLKEVTVFLNTVEVV